MSTAISIRMPYLAERIVPTFFERRQSAVSPEARLIEDNTSAATTALEKSQALFGEKAAALSQLKLLADECKEDNWDGYGANAIDEGAVFFAARFVRALPEDLPVPEFAAEPEGSISLDWIKARNHMFTVSVAADNRLAYAWLDGTDKGHAVARFDGQSIPAYVESSLRRHLL